TVADAVRRNWITDVVSSLESRRNDKGREARVRDLVGGRGFAAVIGVHVYREAGKLAGRNRRRIAEAELDLRRDGLRVRQTLRPPDRDDQPRAVGLHVAQRVIDRIGISERRVHVFLAVDQRHVGVELPVILLVFYPAIARNRRSV